MKSKYFLNIYGQIIIPSITVILDGLTRIKISGGNIMIFNLTLQQIVHALLVGFTVFIFLRLLATREKMKMSESEYKKLIDDKQKENIKALDVREKNLKEYYNRVIGEIIDKGKCQQAIIDVCVIKKLKEQQGEVDKSEYKKHYELIRKEFEKYFKNSKSQADFEDLLNEYYPKTLS